MKPITFPQSNVVYAKDQPEYLPLPAYRDEAQTISLWRLSWRERLTVLVRGRLWLRQMNFGRSLQPQRIQVESPFAVEVEDTGVARPRPRAGSDWEALVRDGAALGGDWEAVGKDLRVALDMRRGTRDSAP